MIPLRDENPAERAPIVTRIIILLNCVVFLYELLLGPDVRLFLGDWGLVPVRLTIAFQTGREPLFVPAATLITSMFLHGGWLHLLGNMWYLWIFGDNVEDRLGRRRYVFFYLMGGVVAALLHYAVNPDSRLPTVGASGAIAAVLGGYAITFPGARVITLMPFFPFWRIVPLPALLVLGLWFVLQSFSGAMSLAWTRTTEGGGTAWWAHVGGFVFGAMMVKLLGVRPQQRVHVD